MAYQLRVYAPVVGVSSVSIYGDGSLIDTVIPMGTSNACFNQKNCTYNMVKLVATPDDGYTITNWVVNFDGTRQNWGTDCNFYAGDSSYTNIQALVEVEEDTPQTTTYYATLEFDANGGTGAPSSIDKEQDDDDSIKFTIPSKTPSWSGYDFEGWSEYSDGSGTLWYTGESYTCYGSERGTTTTLYASWSQQTVYTATLNYNANGGSGAPSPQSKTSTDQLIYFTISSVTPTNPGYTFGGWSMNSSGTGTIYHAGDSYNNYGNTSSSGASYTLYAVWTLTTYYATLNFNANDGSGAPSSQSGSSTDSSGKVTFTIPSQVPTKKDYAFLGWSENSSGSGTLRQPNDKYSVNGSTSSSGYSYTLYAAWTKDTSGYAWMYIGGWKKVAIWIYSGGWKRAIGWVYSGGWKKSG